MSDAESHWKLLMDRDFLGAADLRGRDVTLTIKSVARGELPIAGSSKTQRKPVLTFEETDRKVAMNATNCTTVAKLYGVHTSKWPGKRITFYPAMTKFGREDVECIRVRAKVPPPKAAKAEQSKPAPEPYDGPPEDVQP